MKVALAVYLTVVHLFLIGLLFDRYVVQNDLASSWITETALPVVPPNFSASYLENPTPVYPPLARRVGEQGKVMLRVLVNAKGTADTVELRSSSGSTSLDEAALESVKHWRFVPARQGDQPVPAWVLIPITFSLKG